MPIPFILGAIAVATGAIGVGKGVKGISDTKEANDVQERAEGILHKAKKSMEGVKESTTTSIKELGKTKIQVSAGEIKDFVDIYSKIHNVKLEDSIGLQELKKMKIDENTLKEMKETALGATDVLSGGIAGIGAGALLGWGTYGGVMALGTASTGAAIGGLSGVAATNATLAWLGGGAIAAGGGGMALGAAVLGGIIAGPALLVAGGVFGSKAKEKLHNAYSNLSEAKKISEEMKTAETELKVISDNAEQFNRILESTAIILNKANQSMSKIVVQKTEWGTYTKDEKSVIASAMKTVQVVKKLVDMPLLTEDGVLTQDVRNIIKNPKYKYMQ